MPNVHFLNELGTPIQSRSADRVPGNVYLVRAVDDATDDSTVVFRTEDHDQAAKLCGWLNGAVAEH
jgi:hypothetical protein